MINKLRGEYQALNGIADTCASFNSYTAEDKYTFRRIIREGNDAERCSEYVRVNFRFLPIHTESA